jgi:hypothetical protein
MNFKKLMKNLDVTTMLVIGVAVVAIGYMLNQYSHGKAAAVDTMKGGDAAPPAPSAGVEECTNDCYNVAPASAEGVTTSLPKNDAPVMNAADLLPKDNNSEWAQAASVSADLQGVSLLSAGKHIGMNTVGTSLRNANQQLRPEPANPRFDVGPFLNSTIDSNVDPRNNNPLVA